MRSSKYGKDKDAYRVEGKNKNGGYGNEGIAWIERAETPNYVHCLGMAKKERERRVTQKLIIH